ncbi:MAG: Sec-independent protein translocase subunit TatA/TatB [Flavobacteriales bacterium]|jgi:sec-independent protein translocase protein TatA|tara:strand:+ start:473 stop:667 length:195 start_codon:yes stop_codon:yes gene_type:complete
MLNAVLLMGMPGGPELIVIAIIVLLLFGGKKIPELMKGIGNGIREFKSASKGDEKDIKIDDKNQ